MNKQKNKKAFTLVELIVVITILAILATIAFLSFQSYTKNARDGNRITTLNNIDKGLNIYKTQKGKYPMPDNINGTGTLNGKELIYVGEIGKNIQRLINLNSLPKDPLTNDEFFYGISKDAENYQLAAIYETELSQNAVTSTYADSGYKAKVLGNYEGILKYNSGGICISNIPSLLFATGGEIDLKNENVGFIVNKGENLPYKSLKSKAILKPTTDILKMISNTGSVTTECKTEEEWKEAFLEEQKKQELETKFGYEIDKTGKQIFGDKYFKEIKKEEGLSLSTDLYSLSDDELKKIFTSKNVFTNNWENTSLCNVSSMNIDETTFHPGTFNQDLIFTGNTIYKIPAGEYIFSKANVDEYYFTKYGSNCIGFIGEGENKTIIKNADSGDSIFLVDGGNNIILSGFSINRDDPNTKLTGIHIKETSNNTTLTNIKVENQDNGIYIDGNATLGFINTKNNQNGIFHTKGNLIIKDSSFNNNSGIGIYSVGGNLTIKNTTANGNSNNGFNNHGGNNHLIENSHFDNNSWIGIYSTSGNLTIKNTTANGNSNNGFNNHGGNNHIIENSHFDNNSGMGIYSTSGNLTIKNSTANGNSNNGFNASGGDNHIIENSEFNNNKENGIYHSSSSSSIDIDGTTFNGNLKDGLLFQGSVRSSVKNSTFDGNTENGLSGYGPIDIENITLSNNKRSGIVVYSGNNTINTVTSSNNLNNNSQDGGFILYGSNNNISSISSHDNERSGFIIYGSNNQINNLNSSNNKENGLIISGGTNTINTLDANNNLMNGIKIESWARNNIVNSYEGGLVTNDGGETNIIYAR